mmetsp:Transcript_38757/g.112038  ORF Transcript_38757/g.112038 Transcript_38757/m.112038 type:complete len:143 (+) Transcript_38757:105-533(+)
MAQTFGEDMEVTVAGDLGATALAADLRELEGRAIRAAEKRRAAISRMAETRRKMRELGQKITDQEAMLRVDIQEYDNMQNRIRSDVECAPTAPKAAAAPAGDGVQAAGPQGAPLRRTPLPQLRGSYSSRAAVAAASVNAPSS